MDGFDLEPWLTAHSLKVEETPTEIVFSHQNGETSVLVRREGFRREVIAVSEPPLASFYARYAGASIGGSQIIIATDLAGGVDVSHGFRIPDLIQMESQVEALGVLASAPERIFMVEAAWMFVYGVSSAGGTSVLRAYDRDFGTSRVIEKFQDVLDAWWQIVIAG